MIARSLNRSLFDVDCNHVFKNFKHENDLSAVVVQAGTDKKKSKCLM